MWRYRRVPSSRRCESACSAAWGVGFSSTGIAGIIVVRAMHEAAILSALREQVESFAPEGSVVHEVKIDVGGLEHLDAEVMTTLWEALSMDTRLAGSRLSVTPVPVRVRCRECAAEHEPEDPAVLVCPGCGAVRPEILEGTGVILRSLEVEQ